MEVKLTSEEVEKLEKYAKDSGVYVREAGNNKFVLP